MKPTPRTDAMVGEEHCEGLYQRVEEYHTLADFARDLERELAAEQQISENLLLALKAIEDHHNFTEEWREIARNAIAQAESGDEPTYTDCPIHGRHEGDCPRC